MTSTLINSRKAKRDISKVGSQWCSPHLIWYEPLLNRWMDRLIVWWAMILINCGLTSSYMFKPSQKLYHGKFSLPLLEIWQENFDLKSSLLINNEPNSCFDWNPIHILCIPFYDNFPLSSILCFVDLFIRINIWRLKKCNP